MTTDAGKRSCGGLVERLLARQEEAFADFVQRYKSEVFMCCRMMGLSEQEAEDAASDTFLAAYKGLRQYRGEADLGTWLWRIAYRQAVNYLRKNRRYRELVYEADELACKAVNCQPGAAAQQKEQSELVWQAVRRLPRLWAVAIVLYYRQERPVREIAKIMRIRQNTVKTYLFRARQMLKEILSGVFGEGECD